MTEAVVVGSGPNGLAAAIRLAQAGLAVRVLEASDTIGGGARSSERTVPGVVHDDCSAFHPLGVAASFFRSVPLGEHGLRWRWPEIDLAHPLESGAAGVMVQDIDHTVDGLGEDGASWRRLFGPLVESFDDLLEDILRPMAHVPAHPLVLARFGARAAMPASWTARRWRDPATSAMFAGVAAHAFTSLRAPLSSAVGLMLLAAGHAHGWPVAEGGTQAITDAMVRLLGSLGGSVETGCRVETLDQLGRPDIVMLDLAPAAVAAIAGDRLPRSVARAFRRYRRGPGIVKLDLAIAGHLPWTNEACRRAGTVHLGGTFEELAAAEHDVVRGVMPARPFVLVGQQYLADPSRSVGDINPIWAYAHVPHGHRGPVDEAIVDQIERFAPGTRAQIVARHVRTTAQVEQDNANFVGGDISTGLNGGRHLVSRPRIATDPYSTGIAGVYICSAATPPGPGVHGMCGANAAASALRHLDVPVAEAH